MGFLLVMLAGTFFWPGPDVEVQPPNPVEQQAAITSARQHETTGYGGQGAGLRELWEHES